MSVREIYKLILFNTVVGSCKIFKMYQLILEEIYQLILN